MQKRSGERWLGVLCAVASAGLLVQLAAPSSAWAAPKKKKPKAAAAAPAEEPPASSEGQSVDEMMENSGKGKSVRQQRADDESAASAAQAPANVGEPDAWERPPVEEEKPKRSKLLNAPEVKKGDGRHWDIAILLGWGFQTTKAYAADPYGFGGGLRILYELDSHITFGLGGEYFIGNSVTGTNSPGSSVSTQQITSRAQYTLIHAEFGYNLWFSDNRVLLRPSIWAGAGIGYQSKPLATGTSGIDTSFLLGPGLVFNYMLGSDSWYLGAEIRVCLQIGSIGPTGVPLLAQLGKRF
jgi:hypothetical protein